MEDIQMHACTKYSTYSVSKMAETSVAILCSLIYSKAKGPLC